MNAYFKPESTTASTRQGQSQLQDVTFCTEGYAEPGYSDPKSGVIAFGNWNDVSHWNARISGSSSPMMMPLAGSPSCLKRLASNSNGRTNGRRANNAEKQFAARPTVTPGSGTTPKSKAAPSAATVLKADPTAYLESLEGEENSCLTISLELEEHGYVLLEGGYEHGFYGGQDADPRLIAKALKNQGISRFVFDLDSVGQFDLSFSLWVHKDELASLDEGAFAAVTKDGPSVSEGLRRSLEDAATKLSSLPDVPGHPKVARCDVSTGTALVKLVTPEAFVAGQALEF